MNRAAYTLLLFLSGIMIMLAQPKLGQVWKGAKSGETLETPLGFQNKETQEINKVMYAVGVDKSDKIMYIETKSSTFKVDGYNLSTRFSEFKNYNYTRFFDGWGYYLRLNTNWCAYFGKTKPVKTSKPILFFNYNFGKAEGKAVFDSSYEEALAAEIKAQKEKEEKKKKEKEQQAKKKADYEKAQAEAKKREEEAKKAELARKEALQKEAQRIKEEKEAKKREEEERKQKYAKELAEYNAKKEAEKKAKEAEKKRKSEEFRTGQKIQNTELAEQTNPKNNTTNSATETTKTSSKKGTKLKGGELLLDQVLNTRIKKGLSEYLNFIKKNKKRTENYPLVLINYKDIADFSTEEIIKIQKINSTTVFKKGHKRCDDFKELGTNGVIIIKAE